MSAPSSTNAAAAPHAENNDTTSTAAWKALKDAGNDAYRAGEVSTALQRYGEALQNPDVPDEDRATLLCNRAQCFLRQKEYESAIQDCTTCLTLSPHNVKALFRRGTAHEKLGKTQDALSDYEEALAASPGHREIAQAIGRLDPSRAPQQRRQAKDAQQPGSVAVSAEEYKEYMELEARLQEIGQQIGTTRDKQRTMQRQKRQLELTRTHVKELPEETRTFRGLGRAFLHTPRATLTQQLDGEVDDYSKKIGITEETLKYLDRQQKEADSNYMEYIRSLRSRQK